MENFASCVAHCLSFRSGKWRIWIHSDSFQSLVIRAGRVRHRKEHCMGREANCRCNWASESADCKVLLETHELIVRGGIRRRVAISSLTQICVDGDQLRFRAGAEDVALGLGATQAERWAKTLSTPPP